MGKRNGNIFLVKKSKTWDTTIIVEFRQRITSSEEISIDQALDRASKHVSDYVYQHPDANIVGSLANEDGE